MCVFYRVVFGFVLAVMVLGSAFADVHECLNANGETIYRSRGCERGERQISVDNVRPVRKPSTPSRNLNSRYRFQRHRATCPPCGKSSFNATLKLYETSSTLKRTSIRLIETQKELDDVRAKLRDALNKLANRRVKYRTTTINCNR